MVTQPIEYDDCLSKIGVQVVPALVVFQTPPDATATYQVLGSSGWMAMSAIRPDISAGPMLRSSSPENVFALNGLEKASSSSISADQTRAVRVSDTSTMATGWRMGSSASNRDLPYGSRAGGGRVRRKRILRIN